ncbi:hypothetical protein [Pandoraea vervacti]|uniref:hypothetical protein n=1 Tax=Pandoraea vervacti TaxID=656178 RepID=UPI0012F51C40|nr:hypothetical protein [Pandoraea vervacti]
MSNGALMRCLPALALCVVCQMSAVEPPARDIDSALTQCLDAPDKQSTGDQDACIVEATRV